MSGRGKPAFGDPNIDPSDPTADEALDEPYADYTAEQMRRRARLREQRDAAVRRARSEDGR